MIESLSVENFRCFESLQLHGLSNVNVVVGRNASGKTALLESIFLAAGGSPEIGLRFRLWRGMSQAIQTTIDRQNMESLWRELFFAFDQKRKISLQIFGSQDSTASVEISYTDQAAVTVPLDKSDTRIEAYPLVFEWKDHTGKISTGRIRIGGARGLELDTFIGTVPALFFATGWGSIHPTEHAQRFSNLSQTGDEKAVIQAVREEFDFIEDVSVQLSGGIGVIHVSTKDFSGTVPAGVVSNGVMKFIYLLVAIAANKNGILLVDEIEAGFYYDRLPSIWAILLRFCKANQCQLFTTTHSDECLRAMLPCAEKESQSFSLVRTTKKGISAKAEAFSGRTLTSLIRQGIDARG